MTSSSSCTEVLRSVLRSHCDGNHHHIDYIELFLDFENALPSEQERHVCDLAEKVIVLCRQALEDIKCYGKGGSDVAHVTLSKQEQNADTVDKACKLLMALALRQRSYFDVSKRIELLIPELLWDLCSGPLPPEEQLESRQATVKQLAHVIDFVMDFDTIKMCTPALSNDLSFYKRMVAEQNPSELESANQVCLFLAQPAPMLASLAAATKKFVEAHPDLPLGNTTDTLATIVGGCCYMVTNDEAVERLSPVMQLYCIRIMVGCVILYDHVDDNGAFVKDSAINLRAVVGSIRQRTAAPVTESLLNGLRYTSKHYNSATTCKTAKLLLALA